MIRWQLHNDAMNNVRFLQIIIRVLRGRVKWAGHVTLVGEM
jgi:hypothetical protein